MRILLTNQDLTRRGGVQLFAFDLACKLDVLGHEPIVHSAWLGVVSDDLRARGIPVTGDLRTITVPPDVIIGNHHISTMTALHQFPGTPAIFVCHTISSLVPHGPRIRRYVAVDEACRSHLIYESGVDDAKVEVILNSVDLTRFPQRASLPARPRRALLFGNQFEGSGPWRAIEIACRKEGLELDIVGRGAGRVEHRPEHVLPQYDLVFARARSALEAMASGAATILAGPNRMGRFVTSADIEGYRRFNFGRRAMTTMIDAASVSREIARYDPVEAAAVSSTIRQIASLDLAVSQFVRLAEDVVEEHLTTPVDPAAESAATAAFFAELESSDLVARLHRLRGRIADIPVIGRLALRLARRIIR